MNREIFGALAMDLKRAALSYFRGSDTTAQRFIREAIIRKNEINPTTVKPYLKRLLMDVEQLQNEHEKEKIAEDALMLSTRFQNAALKQ